MLSSFVEVSGWFLAHTIAQSVTSVFRDSTLFSGLTGRDTQTWQLLYLRLMKLLGKGARMVARAREPELC